MPPFIAGLASGAGLGDQHAWTSLPHQGRRLPIMVAHGSTVGGRGIQLQLSRTAFGANLTGCPFTTSAAGRGTRSLQATGSSLNDGGNHGFGWSMDNGWVVFAEAW